MAENNKQRLSVSVSTETVELIDESLKLEKFRNRSHIVEFSLKNTLCSLTHPTSKRKEVGDINKVLKDKQNSTGEIKENA